MNLIQKEGGNQQFQHHQPTQNKNTTNIQNLQQNRVPPNLLRIKADNQDKQFMCMFWSLFLVFVIVIIIIAKTLPSIVQTVSNTQQLAVTSLENCTNPNSIVNDTVQCGLFNETNPSVGLVTRHLSALNQFLMIYLIITPYNPNVSSEINQNVQYMIYGLNQVPVHRGLEFAVTNLYENQTSQFNFTSLSTSNQLYGQDGKKVIYWKKYLGFIGQFSEQNLYIKMKFLNNITSFVNAVKFQMQAFYISKGFTQFTIAIRYLFFFISLLTAYLYISKYRKIPVQSRIVQQTMIVILSILVLFFNDPFYPITVLHQNMASSFFSTLFVLVFVVYLIFLWIIFIDRIYYEQGLKETQQIKLWKIIYCIVLFILLMVYYMAYAAFRLNDHPVVPSQKLTTGKFLVLDIILTIWFCLGIGYISIQYIRCCCYKRSELLWRNQLFMMYSIFFEAALIFFILVDNSLGAYEYNGSTVIFVYGLMNLYVWYLQYMYTSCSKTDQELIQKRSINSDQLMSVGTVQFNDLNINLDDEIEGNNNHKPLQQKQLVGLVGKKNYNQQQQEKGWGKNLEGKKINWGSFNMEENEKREEEKKNMNVPSGQVSANAMQTNFSIEDEQQEQAYKNVKIDLEAKVEDKRKGLQTANNMGKSEEKTDFFNQKQIKRYNTGANDINPAKEERNGKYNTSHNNNNNLNRQENLDLDMLGTANMPVQHHLLQDQKQHGEEKMQSELSKYDQLEMLDIEYSNSSGFNNLSNASNNNNNINDSSNNNKNDHSNNNNNNDNSNKDDTGNQELGKKDKQEKVKQEKEKDNDEKNKPTKQESFGNYSLEEYY